MALGALGYVGYGVEVTEGSSVTPTFFLPVNTFSFEDSNDFIVPDQVRGSRDRSIALAAPYNVSGSMEVDLPVVDIGPLLLSALTATVVSSAYAGGGYQHVFTPDNSEKTLSFESSAAGILIMRYAGVRVNTLEIKSAYGEIVTSSWGLEGLNREKRVSATGSATPSSILPFHFSGSSIKIAGSASGTVKDFSFTIGNNLERAGTLRKTRAWKRMSAGMRDVGLSMTFDFADTAEYDRFMNADEFAVELHLEGPTIPTTTNKYTLVIGIPKVQYNKAGVPISTGQLEQSIDCLVTRADGQNIVNVTWVTSQSAAAAGLA
jgi:hypothetical protein